MLHDGHEFGNHGLVDKSYANDTKEDFASALDECSQKITSLQRKAGLEESGSNWFRAPHGKLSAAIGLQCKSFCDESFSHKVYCQMLSLLTYQ